MLTSQALVLATAMAASAGTFIIFNLFQDKYSPIPRNNQYSHLNPKQPLKSCLASGGKKRDGNRGKRVRFAEDTKDSRVDLEVKKVASHSCGKEMVGSRRMPANRVALYSGILKDRFQRMEYSC